jgi:RNA polymerase sigma factor (sigma-70 family)
MATKRRRPGTLPPALTEEQAAQVRRCHPIGVHVAMYYVRRQPPGLKADDILGAAEEAVTLAICTYTTEKKVSLEGYVWARVRSTLKTLIRRSAERLGPQAPNDSHESRVALAGGEALDEYAQTVEDRGNVLRDTREQQIAQYDEAAQNGATALVVGGGGHLWNMRGDLGLVLRIEYLRTNKALHDEVARLPAKHATIIELRFFRELPVKEVAAGAGVSESTVSRMIGEAIPLLKARLEARGVKDLSCFEGR